MTDKQDAEYWRRVAAHRQALLDLTRHDRTVAELSRDREANRYEALRADVNDFYVMLVDLANSMDPNPYFNPVLGPRGAKELVRRFGLLLERDNERTAKR